MGLAAMRAAVRGGTLFSHVALVEFRHAAPVDREDRANPTSKGISAQPRTKHLPRLHQQAAWPRNTTSHASSTLASPTHVIQCRTLQHVHRLSQQD